MADLIDDGFETPIAPHVSLDEEAQPELYKFGDYKAVGRVAHVVDARLMFRDGKPLLDAYGE